MDEIKNELEAVIADARSATAAWASPEAVAAREAEERVASAKRNASHVAEWRSNLRKFARLAEWEVAWEPRLKTAAIKTVDSWLADGCPFHMFLFGPVGCGKSIAAAHAVKRWVEPDTFKGEHPVSWLRPSELVSAVFHSYDDRSPKLGRRVVIEDIGARDMPKDFEDALIELLDMPDITVLATSNATSEQFRERFTDERLYSRLNHCAKAFRLKGASLRRSEGGF
jgi:DNA replication protein DnaC